MPTPAGDVEPCSNHSACAALVVEVWNKPRDYVRPGGLNGQPTVRRYEVCVIRLRPCWSTCRRARRLRSCSPPSAWTSAQRPPAERPRRNAHAPDGTGSAKRQSCNWPPGRSACTRSCKRRMRGRPARRPRIANRCGHQAARWAFSRPWWEIRREMCCNVGKGGMLWAAKLNPGGRAPPIQPPGFGIRSGNENP